jgi:hypothetical protein
MHVEQVLGDIPLAQRCRCREERPKDSGGANRALRSRIRALFAK